jgi:tRNA 2-thiouridine synthesizing protein D
MRYTLLVLTPPDSGSSARHALGFAQALCDAGHEIHCVFFYDAGVLTALADTEAAQDERDLRAGWTSLAQEKAVRLLACVASAVRFGLGEDAASGRMHAAFRIAGLGELIEASSESDRLMTFAG